MFRTLGRGGKKEKAPAVAMPTGPVHGMCVAQQFKISILSGHCLTFRSFSRWFMKVLSLELRFQHYLTFRPW